MTLNADFHAMLAVSGKKSPSVIRLRMQGLGAPAVVALVANMLSRYAAELTSGCLLTIKSKKTTCHKLPIGSLS